MGITPSRKLSHQLRTPLFQIPREAIAQKKTHSRDMGMMDTVGVWSPKPLQTLLQTLIQKSQKL